MPRRSGLPSVYVAAALFTSAATAVTTAVPLTPAPASGLAALPHTQEPSRPYIVTARNRAAARALVREMRWRVRRYYTAALPGFATSLATAEEAELRADPRILALEPDREIRPLRTRLSGTSPTRPRPFSGRDTTGPRKPVSADTTKPRLPVDPSATETHLHTGMGAPRSQPPFTPGAPRPLADAAVTWPHPSVDAEDAARSRPLSGITRPRLSGDAAVSRRRPLGGAGVTVYVVGSGLRAGALGDRAWRAFDATGGTGDDCTGHGTRAARTVAAVAPRAQLASVRALGCRGRGSLSDVLAALDWVRRHARHPAVATVPLDDARSPALALAARRLVGSGVFVTWAAERGACRIGSGGQAYSAAAPQLAGAAARRLGRRPEAAPAALTSRLRCGPAREPIRQNPSRTSNLLLRTGEL